MSTTCRAGRWHVAFPSPQPQVAAAPGRQGRLVDIDRGVKTTLVLSDGTMLRAPVMRRSEHKKLTRLQRQLARCRKGSARRGKVKARIARLHAGVADRRRDWIEKITTKITATYAVVAVEGLPTRNMVRAPKPKPDPDNPGRYLPNGKVAWRGADPRRSASVRTDRGDLVDLFHVVAWVMKALDKVRMRTMAKAGIRDRYATWATRKNPDSLQAWR